MTSDTLYAHMGGAGLEEVAESLETQFTEFIDNRKWVVGRASIVNQRYGNETFALRGWMPLWDLGLNLKLPDPGTEPPGWFADVDAIAQFLGTLHGKYGRSSIIGITNAETGISEDLFYISIGLPDLGKLRAIIGVIDV